MKLLGIGLLVFQLLTVVACKNAVEEKETAIEKALHQITQGYCADALQTLIDSGNHVKDPQWIKAKASAHACLGGYSTIVLFTNDIPNIGVASTTFLNSTATFTNADMSSPDDARFNHLWDALETLTFAGGVASPTAVQRGAVLGAEPSSDINAYIAYLTMHMLGRYLRFYGDADPTTGIEGSGPLANNCLYDYTQDDAVASLAGGFGGNCTAAYVGHTEIDSSNPVATRAARMCQGVILLNQFIDGFSNITIPTGEPQLSSLSGIIKPAFDAICAAYGAELTDLCNTYALSRCVANHSTTAAATSDRNFFNTVEMYFGLIIESMFQ